jgi:hypothetical protein
VSGVAGVPNETGTWRDATNADVEADDVVGAYKALLTKPVGTSKIEEHNGRVWRLRAVSKDTDPKFTRHRRDVRGWIFQCASSDPGIALEDGHWRDATDDDVAADQTLDTYNSLLAKPVGTEAHEEHNGRIWRFRVVSSTTDPQFTTHARDVRGWVWTCADEPSLLDSVLSAAGLLDAPARVAGGAGSQDLRGLMLEAVRAGRALNTDSLVEVDVRELDLVITVPRRAFRAPVRGYDKPLLLGWSYANLIEVCRLLGMIPLTREMVDAVWAAPFTWRITATGLWAPGADLAMQRVEYAAKQTDTVDAAIQALDNGNGAPPDAVIRDEGKAWIIHEDLPKSAGAVLYGWHDARSGKVLQGLGRGHDADWDDYSMVDPPAQRMARRLSTGEPIDLLAFYRQHFPDPAMQPFLDVFEGVPA